MGGAVGKGRGRSGRSWIRDPGRQMAQMMPPGKVQGSSSRPNCCRCLDVNLHTCPAPPPSPVPGRRKRFPSRSSSTPAPSPLRTGREDASTAFCHHPGSAGAAQATAGTRGGAGAGGRTSAEDPETRRTAELRLCAWGPAPGSRLVAPRQFFLAGDGRL